MNETKYRNINRIVLLVLICSLLVYIILRAYYLSFVHDECLTFKILTGDKGVAKTANDHMLNTLLMSFFYRLFGAHEIILRLPNILGFILYSFFCYKLLIKTTNIVMMLAGASLLLLNPYLLDFFSLARGYGLSLGFGMAAIYYLLRQERFSTYKQYVTGLAFSLFFSLLSAYSNLFCINLNIALIIIFIIELYVVWNIQSIQIQLNNKRKAIIASVIICNFLILAYPIHKILILKSSNELDFGGNSNFIDQILTNLIYRSIYFSYYGEQFWKITRQIIIAVFAINVVYQLFSKKYTHLTTITILIFLMIFAPIMQHYVFGSFFPPERTSLIYIPLFGLLMFYFLSDIYSRLSNKYSIIAFNLLIFITLCIPLGGHLITNLNLKYTKEWMYDSHTKNVMKTIAEKQQNDFNKDRKISISNSWEFEPSINFYRKLYSMDYLLPATRKEIDLNADFIYCTKKDMEMLDSNYCYIILNNFTDTKTFFLMRKPGCN